MPNTIKGFLVYSDRLRMSGNDDSLIRDFILECKIRNLTDETIVGYVDRLKYLMGCAKSTKKEITDLDKYDLKKYIFNLIIEQRLSTATINGLITVFKLFFNWLSREYPEYSNPMLGIKKRKSEQKLIELLRPEHITEIMKYFKTASFYRSHPFYGSRNRCVVMLLYDSMLRRKEVVTLKVKNIEVMSFIAKVDGKGRKQRIVPLSAKTCHLLNAHIIRYGKIIKDYIVCDIKGQRLNGDALRMLFKKISKKIGIDYYPHLFRHSGAYQYLKNGGNLAMLQAVLGHSDPRITANIYGHLKGEDAQLVHEDFNPGRDVKI